MRMTLFAALLLEISGQIATAAENPRKNYFLDDYQLDSAKSEEEIVVWAKGKIRSGQMDRFDAFRIERLELDGKKLLVLLASPPTATRRTTIFVYVGDERGWGLLLVRHAYTANVKVQADKKAKQLVFRSQAGRLLLILPVEFVDYIDDEKEQEGSVDEPCK